MAYVDDSGGTFIGNIGFGGVTPGFVIHAEKSVAADKLAFFKNTSSTGFGVRFQNGTDLNYAIKVTNGAGTIDTFQAFGDGILQIMPEPSVVTNVTGGVRRDQGLRLYSGKNSDGYNEDATIFMVSNLGGASSQWSGSAHMGYVRMGSDGGIRIELNKYTTTTGSVSSYESGRPSAVFGFDSAGTVSFKATQPSANGTGTYSGQNAQTLIINGLGQDASSYNETQYVDIALMEAGRELAFSTCYTLNTPLRSLILRAPQSSGAPGAVDVRGRLALNRSASEGAPVRWSSGTPTVFADGDQWFDGTNMKIRVGGVTKTFTLT